jgi:hypothetical protein
METHKTNCSLFVTLNAHTSQGFVIQWLHRTCHTVKILRLHYKGQSSNVVQGIVVVYW